MNDAPKTPGQSFTTASYGKSRRKLLQVIKHRPEQSFGQSSVAALIGVGKIVTTRSACPAQGRKRAAVKPQRVTDVVQTDGMSQLRKEHTHYVTPRAEGSCHGIHAGLSRKFRNQMRWNQIAKLSQNSEFGGGWFGISFFHLCRVTELKSHSNHFFLCLNQNSYGMALSFFWSGHHDCRGNLWSHGPGADAWPIGLNRTLEILDRAISALLVTTLLWPGYAREEARNELPACPKW
jgi:hypothetical protein